jgi:hypothetical protein
MLWIIFWVVIILFILISLVVGSCDHKWREVSRERSYVEPDKYVILKQCDKCKDYSREII